MISLAVLVLGVGALIVAIVGLPAVATISLSVAVTICAAIQFRQWVNQKKNQLG